MLNSEANLHLEETMNWEGVGGGGIIDSIARCTCVKCPVFMHYVFGSVDHGIQNQTQCETRLNSVLHVHPFSCSVW